jgi:hypothetical protein
MASSFSHLKQGKLSSVTYTLWDVQGEPKLEVKFAGETNKPYFNEVLKRAEHIQRAKRKIDAGLIAENRTRDRQSFPKYVIVGWKDVKDADGKEVSFTTEDCESFLNALDDDQFDGIREFAKDASNFREFVDKGNTPGNSQSV